MKLFHLSPIGNFPHQEGTQRVDAEALNTILEEFNSFRGKLARRFAGLPVYAGHPDAPELRSRYPDTRVRGWITRLHASEKGLYGEVQWNESGEKELRDGLFKYLSPYWEAEEIESSPGRPV